jgi:hypothetical protein
MTAFRHIAPRSTALMMEAISNKRRQIQQHYTALYPRRHVRENVCMFYKNNVLFLLRFNIE